MAYDMIANGRCRVCETFTFQKMAEPGNGYAAFAIDENNRLWSWGRNGEGQASQGDPHYEYAGGQVWNIPENYLIPSPKLVYNSEGDLKSDWVKITYGEWSSMAIDEDGVLWGCGECYFNDRTDENCASFGLPHDSGTDQLEWKDPARTNYQYYFYFMTQCSPGNTFKDFIHNYYGTHVIGTDDRLYFFGHETTFGNSGITTIETAYVNPTLVGGITDTIRILGKAAEFGYMNGVITTTDKVLVWGDPYELTNFNASYDPDIEPILDLTGNLSNVSDIIELALGYTSILVLYSNGSVYGRGLGDIIGHSSDSYDSWVEITALSDISSLGLSQDNAYAIDSDGNLYTWGYGIGSQAVSIDTTRKFLDFTQNAFASCWGGVDSNGALYTWGYQSTAPLLGIGTCGYQAENDLLGITADPEYSVIDDPTIADYDSESCTVTGEPNIQTEFIGFSEQEHDHFPCGHWHKGPPVFPEEFPYNCWVPVLDIDDGKILMVMAGKLPDFQGEGYDLVFAHYDISTNTWTNIWSDTLILTSVWVGEAKISGAIYGFCNYKATAVFGAGGYSLSDYGFGVWIYNSGMDFTYFPDASEEQGMNKFDLNSSGKAVVMYTDKSSGDTYVKYSDDYGSTWSTIKTIGADSARKDYGIKLDSSDNIFIAYMTSSTTVRFEKSDNNGLTWDIQDTLTTQTITEDIHFDESGGKFYLGVPEAYYYSDDECVSWTEIIQANLSYLSVGYGAKDYNIGVFSDNYLYRYTDSWNNVTEDFDIDGTKKTLQEYVGTWAYIDDKLTYQTATKRTVGILLSSQEGEYWNLISTPFVYYDGEAELIDRYPKPTWPFKKQHDVWGYMEDTDFYNYQG